jgi:hypothetical protein
MTQTQLNRAVATATGESVRHIAHMGFSLMALPARPCPHPKGNARRHPIRSSRRRRGVPAGRYVDVAA